MISPSKVFHFRKNCLLELHIHVNNESWSYEMVIRNILTCRIALKNFDRNWKFKAYLLFNFNENNNYQKLFHSFENKDDIYNVDTLILFKDKQPFTR